MQLAHYLGLLERAERNLADALRMVADGHGEEPDVTSACRMLAGWSERHAEELRPFAARYGEEEESEPDRLHNDLFGDGIRSGALGLLRDLHDLVLMATECDISWTVVGQAAKGAKDKDLVAVVDACEQDTSRQLLWLKSRMKQAAPQILVVA